MEKTAENLELMNKVIEGLDKLYKMCKPPEDAYGYGEHLATTMQVLKERRNEVFGDLVEWDAIAWRMTCIPTRDEEEDHG